MEVQRMTEERVELQERLVTSEQERTNIELERDHSKEVRIRERGDLERLKDECQRLKDVQKDAGKRKGLVDQLKNDLSLVRENLHDFKSTPQLSRQYVEWAAS